MQRKNLQYNSNRIGNFMLHLLYATAQFSHLIRDI